MIRPSFLGAGIATHLGTGIDANLRGLHQPPGATERITRRLSGYVESIPYKLLADFPLEDAKARLDGVIGAVIDEAVTEARVPEPARRRMALFIGSSSFDIAVSEDRYRRELAGRGPALPLRSSSFSNLAARVRRRYGLYGEEYSFNTACTSSANALSYAARSVRAGATEFALVLGVELLNDLTALGFLGLGLLSRSEMRPFDRRRDGLVLGEAAAALVIGPGGAGGFHWSGAANLCDTHSVVASRPDGWPIAEVMRAALASAKLRADEIAAVKTHGTANPANDDAEAAGMRAVFEEVPRACALKPFIGHTLGACGLAETILFYRGLERGFLVSTPGTAGTSSATGLTLNPSEVAPEGGHFMLNTFGFGGNDSSTIVSRS